jgi:hypothetical protein
MLRRSHLYVVKQQHKIDINMLVTSEGVLSQRDHFVADLSKSKRNADESPEGMPLAEG